MKTQLVVINENALGYIAPEAPQSLYILRASVIKGSTMSELNVPYPLSGNTLRLATEKDFDDYRVCFNGYKNNPQEYEFSK